MPLGQMVFSNCGIFAVTDLNPRSEIAISAPTNASPCDKTRYDRCKAMLDAVALKRRLASFRLRLTAPQDMTTFFW